MENKIENSMEKYRKIDCSMISKDIDVVFMLAKNVRRLITDIINYLLIYLNDNNLIAEVNKKANKDNSFVGIFKEQISINKKFNLDEIKNMVKKLEFVKNYLNIEYINLFNSYEKNNLSIEEKQIFRNNMNNSKMLELDRLILLNESINKLNVQLDNLKFLINLLNNLIVIYENNLISGCNVDGIFLYLQWNSKKLINFTKKIINKDLIINISKRAYECQIDLNQLGELLSLIDFNNLNDLEQEQLLETNFDYYEGNRLQFITYQDFLGSIEIGKQKQLI